MAWRGGDANPIIRTASVELADWPAGEHPVRAVLILDLHFCSPSMGEGRIARVRGQLKRLKPQIIFLADDFVARFNGGAWRAQAKRSRDFSMDNGHHSGCSRYWGTTTIGVIHLR